MQPVHYVEKLKDPSHVRALTVAEFLEMAESLGLQQLRTQFYQFELELETSMKAFFPNPGDSEKIRRIFRDDVGQDNLGLKVHLRDEAIHFAYPVLILVGKKAA